MAANGYFSRVLRVQTEHAHTVVSSGPSCWARHRGHARSVLHDLAVRVLLGSWPAFVISLLSTALPIRRTALEDRYLHERLAGYVEYARQVRYRSLPGVS